MKAKQLSHRLFGAGLALAVLLAAPAAAVADEGPFLGGTMPMMKDGKNVEAFACVAVTSPSPPAVMRAARLTEVRCTGSSLADAEIIASRTPQDEAWNAYVARTFQCAAPDPQATADGYQEVACRASGGWRRLSLRVTKGDGIYYVLVVPAARQAALETVAVLAGEKERRPAQAGALADLYDETRLLNGDPQTAYYEASRAAENYMAREDYEKAERALRGALDAWERMPVDEGTRRSPPPTLLLMYGLALSNQERFGEADAQFRRVADALPYIEPPPSHKVYRAMHEVNRAKRKEDGGDLGRAERLLSSAAAEYETALDGGEAAWGGVATEEHTERLALARDALDMKVDIAPSLREKTRPELLDNYKALLYLQAEIKVRQGDPAGAVRLLTAGADRIERDQPTASGAFASRTWSAALHEAAGAADNVALANAVARLESASDTLIQIGLGGRPQAVTWMRLDALYRSVGRTGRSGDQLFGKARDTLRAFGQFVSPAELEAHMLDQFNRAQAAEKAGDRQGADAIQRQMLDDLQLIRGPRIAQAMVDNALTADSGDEEVKGLVQRIRVLEREIRAANDDVGQLLATPDTPGRATRLEELKGKITASQDDLLKTQLLLQEKAPTYSKLAQAPVSLGDVQKRLAGGQAPEALVTFMTGPTRTFGFLMDATRVRVWTTPMTRGQAEKLIGKVRASASLETLAEGADYWPEDFDLASARALYKGLFNDRSWLADAAGRPYAEVKVITSGSLAALPLALLVTKDPPEGDADWSKVQPWDVPWLIQDIAIRYLPSLRAVAAAETEGRRDFALDYLGFGVNHIEFTDTQLSTLGGQCDQDIQTLRGMAALTAQEEVTAVASTFTTGGQGRAEHLVAGDFSVDGVQAAAERMRGARVLHFASHAFQGGVLRCLKEPGILVTPPAEVKAFDDLFLTAMSVSRFKLNADLVVLSACSTAAAGGGPDREPLSGLVNGFLVAGARSVMTTFWNAPNRAAGMTTNDLFDRLRRTPGLSTAEALRQAQLTVMRTPLTAPATASRAVRKFAHPYVWAVFGLVGDSGGSAAAGNSNPPSL